MSTAPRRRKPGPVLWALLVAPAVATCVTAPRPPGGPDGDVPARPPTEERAREGEATPVDSGAAPARAATDETAPSGQPAPDGAAVFDIDSLVAGVRERSAVERPRSILPFGITWSPAAVKEGSAVAFRILQPRGGLEPEQVDGAFAGHPVRFGRLGSAWVGIGVVPIGSRGPDSLRLSLRFAGDVQYEQSAAIEVEAREWDRTTMRVAPGYSSPPPEVQARIARERRQIRAVLDTATAEWLMDGPFISPRPYDVTSPFGQERVFNDELQSRHTGVDLRGTVGTPVYAAGRGRVALTGDFYFSGNGIILDHGLGTYTGYFHLSEILVAPGDTIEKGELIGRVGATGRVTGPHLHWSLWVDGTGLDASSLLEMNIPQP